MTTTQDIAAATERLCKAPCRWWTTLREQYVIEYDGEDDDRGVMVKHQWETDEPSCKYDIRPLTTTGEDCPYFQQANKETV